MGQNAPFLEKKLLEQKLPLAVVTNIVKAPNIISIHITVIMTVGQDAFPKKNTKSNDGIILILTYNRTNK